MHLCIYIDIDIARCSHTGHANDLERWFSEEVHVLLAADDCINGLRAFDVGSMAHCSARTRPYISTFSRPSAQTVSRRWSVGSMSFCFRRRLSGGVAFNNTGFLATSMRRVRGKFIFSFSSTHIHRHSIPIRLSACLLACFALASEVIVVAILILTVPVLPHPIFVPQASWYTHASPFQLLLYLLWKVVGS